MRPQGSETLRVEIIEKNGVLVTRWLGKIGDSERHLSSNITITQLGHLRRKVGEGLQKVKNVVGVKAGPLSWSKVNCALAELQDVGDRLAFELFGNQRVRVSDIFRAQCVGWDSDIAPVPVISITGFAEKMVPFEFLPCLYDPREDPLKKPAVSDINSLTKFLRQFVGFSCIVKRVVEAGEICRGNLLQNRPQLPMKLFVCRSLAGVRKEERNFAKLSRFLDLDAWPMKRVRGTPSQLASHLWNTMQTTTSVIRSIPDQIHHFASHCSTDHDDSDKHSITLAGCSKSGFSAPLGTLIKSFGKLSRTGGIEERPLVFVNACGSSRVNPDRVGSLPDLFMNRLRSRGYIGTETTMSDSVAAEFSYQFYDRLLRGGDLGATLHDVRWWLVRKYRNPLGLFYTCYADPALRVSHPISTNQKRKGNAYAKKNKRRKK